MEDDLVSVNIEKVNNGYTVEYEHIEGMFVFNDLSKALKHIDSTINNMFQVTKPKTYTVYQEDDGEYD